MTILACKVEFDVKKEVHIIISIEDLVFLNGYFNHSSDYIYEPD